MEESQQCNEKKKKRGKERSPCSCLSIIVTDPVFIHENLFPTKMSGRTQIQI